MKRERAESRRLPKSRAALLRVGVLVSIIVVGTLVALALGWLDYRHAVEHILALRQSRNLATFSLLFVLVYGVLTSLGVPGTPLTVAAGALFGTAHGTLLSWTGGMLSGAAGYWIARTVGRDVVTGWIARYRRVDRAVSEARDFRGMVRLRLLPILPMGVVSFVAGLSRAPFLPYLAATAIGLAPTSFIFTYFANRLVAGRESGWGVVVGSVVVASVLVGGISLAPKLLRSRP